MRVPASYPGIHVLETGAHPISAAPTSVALFIGVTPQGPFETPVLVLSFGQYQTAFGPDSAPSEMADQVRQFFLNGGQRAYVVRTPPQPLQYENAFAIAKRDIDGFNIVVLPKASAVDAERAWGPASAFARECRAFLLVDAPASWGTIATASNEIANQRVGVVTDHAAIYWPRLRIANPVNGGARVIDPSGTVAGIYARTDGNRGVWKAPAGTEAAAVGVTGVAVAVSDRENDILNKEAVNCIRSLPSGILAWGARTMAGFDGSGVTDYRYVPVRRTALFIEESLHRGLQFAVFEPNDEPLWARIRQAAGAFMQTLFREGAFQGQRSADAYFVKCDGETTTQADIGIGIVNVVVGFAPLRPAEFVILTIRLMAGQVRT